MLLSLAGIIIVLVFFGAQLQVPTVFARPSYTSSSLTAPATNACCVGNGSTANSGGSSVVTGLPSNMPYTRGGTPLHLSVKITDSAHTTFGYLLTARLVNSLSSQAGTYTLTDANSTTSGLDIEAARFAVSTWSFDWTPPATNVGSVTFYLTGVATTGDTSVSSGVYQSAVTLAPAAPPDFSLSALPSSLTVIQGATVTTPVTANPLTAFTVPLP